MNAGGRYGIVITGTGAGAGQADPAVRKRPPRPARAVREAQAAVAEEAKAVMPARRGARQAAAADRVAGRDRSGDYLPPEREAAFQTRLIKAARWHGWRVVHFRKTRRSGGRGGRGYATAIEGDAGAPDLILAKAGRLPILAELKKDGEYLKPDQKAWRDAIDPAVYRLWRPRDWDVIMAELAS